MTNVISRKELGELMHRLMKVAESGGAEANAIPMSGKTEQIEGLKSRGSFGDLEIMIDEPVSFGGTGTAPNPAEVAMAAMGASLEVTTRCYAEYYGIPVEKISVHLESALDERGFFGTDPSAPVGMAQIKAELHLETSASEEDVQRLFARVQQCCPILDLLRSPTQINLSVKRSG